MVVKSRGYGKTWLTALCCIAMGVLYPGSLIAVVSGTAEQATLMSKRFRITLFATRRLCGRSSVTDTVRYS